MFLESDAWAIVVCQACVEVGGGCEALYVVISLACDLC